ncbi:MAG: hypothetical protein JO125_08840 [Chloroflexi bacterium]|nr:hypothetical protein [Ktedonobacteraceae bacterium]MBV9707498.1 hypothetical protein [Chloroflexota bacterium]
MNNWKLGQKFLESLRTPLGITASSSAGGFHAIFGRDSLWSVIFMLEAAQLRPADQQYRTWVHEVATTILRGMAYLQGKVENDYNEEQPGKIIHEYWGDHPSEHLLRAAWPMADGRYYGTVDATFLYLVCIRQFHELFHDQALLDELWPSIQAALGWALHYSDLDNDGLVEYKRRNPQQLGLSNQVWKDSGDSVLLPGDLPVETPIAWVEIQGYALAAYSSMITFYQGRGELTPDITAQLTERMNALYSGLQRFWMEDEGCFTIALDKNKEMVKAVSSNTGHLLWSKAIGGEQARKVAARLTHPDMLTDWGLRTLSQNAYYYNPLMYHRGTIWPFDNAIAAIGLRQYGYHAQAQRIATAVMRAVDTFTLPVELYCVIPARWIRDPHIDREWLLADYPQSCSVQAWTAAAMLYFTALLGE